MRALAAALVCAVSLAACGEGPAVPVPGVVTATLVSPNGPEGAAHLELIGPGIGEVGGLDAFTFSHGHGDTVNVVVVRDVPGDLRFTVALADTGLPPGIVVLEVADGVNRLRADAFRYSVELSP